MTKALFYDTKKGCQIDYLIQTQINVLYAGEIKFSEDEIKPEVIHQMQQKIYFARSQNAVFGAWL